MSKSDRQIVVRIPTELYKAAEDHASREHRSVSYVVREAVRQYLEELAKENTK